MEAQRNHSLVRRTRGCPRTSWDAQARSLGEAFGVSTTKNLVPGVPLVSE